MATTTQNLGMILPGRDDPVNIAVLNENFRKIDNTAYRVPLLKVVTETAANQIDLDLSTVDLTAYEELILHYCGGSTDRCSAKLRFNGDSSSDAYYSTDQTTEDSTRDGMVLAQTGCGETSGFGGVARVTVCRMLRNTVGVFSAGCGRGNFFYTDYYGGVYLNAGFDQIETMNLYLSSTTDLFKAGTTIKVYGVKG